MTTIMTRKYLWLVLCAALLLFSACQKAPELTITSPSSVELSADGSSGSITFTANRDWKVSSSDSWVTVSPSSGEASDKPVTVSVRCNANTTYDDRTALVTIRMEELSKTVTVRQPANKGVVLPKQTFDLQSDTRSIDVEVQANVQYTVSTSVNWIKQTGTKGLTSKTLTFSIEENKTYDSREGKITIKPQESGVQEQVISVRQAQKDALVVEKTSYDMPYGGGEVEIKVEANVSFDVTPSADWVHYIQTKALSNSTVVLKIDENTTYSPRQGTVEIKQQNGNLKHTITINQAGRIAVTSITLNKTTLTLLEGESETLTATVKPDNVTDKTVTWSSSDETVATVDANGKVSANKEGNSTITAKAGEIKASCVVSVKKPGATMAAIDLGLSVKWATFNIGASSPEESGDYYAWGEIEPIYNYFGNRFYKWVDDDGIRVIKYCPIDKPERWAGSGQPDNKTILDPEDDIAHVLLGDNWRMPTSEDWLELLTNCSWAWTSMNGTYGYEVKSKVEGNTNSIFLPASGSWYENYQYRGSRGYYWSSSLNVNQYDPNASIPYTAHNLYFYSNEHSIKSRERYYGLTIRAILDDNPNKTIPVTSISLNRTNLSLIVGSSFNLSATISPENATDKTVSWTSSNKAVATVSETGEVKAVSEGETTIKAVCGLVDAYCSVTVKKKEEYSVSEVDMGIVITRSDGSKYKLYWADRNIGATKPEDYGEYFAWGYSETNMPYSEGPNSFAKYNASDGKTVLDLEDDTAHVLLGGDWRMPTLEEWEALKSSSTGEWWSKNGVNGLKITSSVNGHTLFLPAAGQITGYDYSYVGEGGLYWTSTLSNDNIQYAKNCYFDATQWEMLMRRRVFGLPVRAVRAEIVETPSESKVVDLGLSVKWATCNLGATKPEEVGDYFAWGETEPKEYYTWGTYKWCNGTMTTITKYCSDGTYGFVDKKERLEPEDDAAHVKLGEKWRMPTNEEFYELVTNCTCVLATINGVSGYKLTSRKEGYENAWIFLPKNEGKGTSASGSSYWTSIGRDHSAKVQNIYRVYELRSYMWVNDYRYTGHPIRPVTE